MAKAKRQKALRRGHRGEMIASLFLMLKGYKIIARNYRCKSGEIDIIARKNDLIAIVEVKARNGISAAVDAVTHQSQRRIINAANFWLSHQKNFAELSLRFDIVAMVPFGGIRAIRPVHLCNAF